MKLNEKMPWWLVVITGALIVAAGIFLIAANDIDPEKNISLKTLMFIVGLIVLLYGIYNFYKAFKLKNNNRLFLAHLVHGILDIILLLLILIIKDSQTLLGVILACWFIVFGLFGLIQTDQSSERNRQMRRINLLLLVIGIALLIVSILFSNANFFVIFLGVVILVIGSARVVQGILTKTRYDERTSGGRSNLF